jgi:hypothetical protein
MVTIFSIAKRVYCLQKATTVTSLNDILLVMKCIAANYILVFTNAGKPDMFKLPILFL